MVCIKLYGNGVMRYGNGIPKLETQRQHGNNLGKTNAFQKWRTNITKGVHECVSCNENPQARQVKMNQEGEEQCSEAPLTLPRNAKT